MGNKKQLVVGLSGRDALVVEGASVGDGRWAVLVVAAKWVEGALFGLTLVVWLVALGGSEVDSH